MLITVMSFGQEHYDTQIDTTKQKIIKLNQVIVTGNLKTDPILTIVSNKYDEKIVQPKNFAYLFNNINGFSVIKINFTDVFFISTLDVNYQLEQKAL